MSATHLLMKNVSRINEADDSNPERELHPCCVSEMSVCSDVEELDLVELEQWTLSLHKAAFGDCCTVKADQMQREQKEQTSAAKTTSCDTEATFSGLQLVASLPSQIARQYMHDVRRLPRRRRGGRGRQASAARTVRGCVHLRGSFEESAAAVQRALLDGISQVIQSVAAKTFEVSIPTRKRQWNVGPLLVVKPNAPACLEFEVVMLSSADKFEAIHALRRESAYGCAEFLLPVLADTISAGSAKVRICV
mmetsp:Transcript_105034/g.191851  ORF Transcript_105034/g.191851 Transcript_105034/m.191851 type:complete len:250 (-) Transcript_105034:363-1112(-)